MNSPIPLPKTITVKWGHSKVGGYIYCIMFKDRQYESSRKKKKSKTSQSSQPLLPQYVHMGYKLILLDYSCFSQKQSYNDASLLIKKMVFT